MTVSATIATMKDTSAIRGRLDATRGSYNLLVNGASHGPSQAPTSRNMRQAILRRCWSDEYGPMPVGTFSFATDSWDSYIIPNSPVYGVHMQDAYRAILDIDWELRSVKNLFWQFMNDYIGYDTIVEDPNFNIATALWMTYTTGTYSWARVRKLERNVYYDGEYITGTNPYPYGGGVIEGYGITRAERSMEAVLGHLTYALDRVSLLAKGTGTANAAAAVMEIRNWPDNPFVTSAPYQNVVGMINWLNSQQQTDNRIFYGDINATANADSKLTTLGLADSSTGIMTRMSHAYAYKASETPDLQGISSQLSDGVYLYSYTVAFDSPFAFATMGQSPIIQMTVRAEDTNPDWIVSSTGISGPFIHNKNSNGFTFYFVCAEDNASMFSGVYVHWHAAVDNELG